jgi:hypothetical protein
VTPAERIKEKLNEIERYVSNRKSSYIDCNHCPVLIKAVRYQQLVIEALNGIVNKGITEKVADILEGK